MIDYLFWVLFAFGVMLMIYVANIAEKKQFASNKDFVVWALSLVLITIGGFGIASNIPW